MMVHRLLSNLRSFSQDILLITGSVLFFGEQVTPMQVFGEFNRVLWFSLSSLFGWKAADSFYPTSCPYFYFTFLLEFLCSHTPLSIRALGEGRRHIGRISVIFFFSPRFASFRLFLLLTSRFSGIGYSIALGGLILFKTSGGK